MSLKSPNSEQYESLEYIFKIRNNHKDNFINWLEECREAAITKVIVTNPQYTNYAVGELSVIDDLLKLIKSI